MTQLKAFTISIKIPDHPLPRHSITVAHLTPGKAKSFIVACLKRKWPESSFASIRSCRRAPELDAAAAAPGAVLAWVSGDDTWEAKK